jgi:pimeloyl-ACP methyl ester carboxylesterase
MKSAHAPVNGLNLYYEIQGQGAPLILLHGGLGSTEMVSPISQSLSQTHQVIAADLQAHGRTADIDRPLTCESMADDIAALLNFLHIDQADIMGYSLGAATALQLTIRHPARVKKLVVVSTVFRRNGWYPEVLAAMDHMGPAAAEMMKPSPLYQTYARVAPNPANWPTLISKVGDLLRRDYDWSKEVAAITAPTMLVFGDADAIRPQHMVEFFALLGGGRKDAGWDGSGMSKARLAILPGVTHYSIADAPALIPTVLPFLDARIPIAK